MICVKKLSLFFCLWSFLGVGCSRSELTESSDNAPDGELSNNRSSIESRSEADSSEKVRDEPSSIPQEGVSPFLSPQKDMTPPASLPGKNARTKGASGLFYTPEELEVWNKRRLSGPYKARWNNHILAHAQLFMTGKRDLAPWPGRVSESCWTPSLENEIAENGAKATWANAAGFVYRILKSAGENTKAAPYFSKVKDYLLAHTTVPGINFRDSKRWCSSSVEGQGSIHFIAAWLRRLAITYSWIRDDMNASNRAVIENWLLGAGEFWVRHNEWHIGKSFSKRYQDDYTCDGPSCPGKNINPVWLYDGGPRHYQINDSWNNRGAVTASAVGIIGIVTGNEVLWSKSKRYFKESLRYSVWPDGTYVDIIRGTPGSKNAWSYPFDYLGSMCSLADALARQGDASLYGYSTREGGVAGTSSGPGDPPKSITAVIMHLAGQLDGSIKKYPSGRSHTNENIINSTNTGGYGDGDLSDLYLAQSNIYYKSDYIRKIYERTAPGTPPPPKHPSAGWDHYTGDWGTYPDVIFMWGGLEGKIWPYGNPNGRTSQLQASQLCGSGERNCSHAFEMR